MKALLAIFFIGLVGGTFYGFYPFVWIAAGLQSALVNIESREAISKSPDENPRFATKTPSHEE
jgi:hypothetical protein